MKLEDLKTNGGMVSPELVKRSAVWEHDGKKDNIEFFVKRASFGAVARAYAEEDRSKSVVLLCECVRLGDKGEEVLTYEQAYSLHAALAACFLEAVTEVNDLSSPDEDDSPKG